MEDTKFASSQEKRASADEGRRASVTVTQSYGTRRESVVGEVVNADEYGHTQRGLKSRHIQLLAIGGTIGTGLFVGSGSILSTVGPAPLLMAYIFMSAILWMIMNALGEMTVYMPIQGLSVPYFVNRFVEPSLAFAAGWNYWYSFSITIAAEATAASIVLEYWTTKVPVAVWITIILVVLLFLNIVAVSWFGEAEFWFASIKILAIIGLIITGVVIFFGGAPDHDRTGFRYWKNPGAFNPYLTSGGTGRFLAFWTAFVRSGFAFVLSPELITTTAGEAQAPRRNLPKAISRYVYRLFFFYILGALVIGVTVPYNSPRLLNALKSGAPGAAASPFVIGIQNAGIPVLNHIINAAILTSAWSCGNSVLYAGSRMLYGLACTGQAPKIFQKCNRNGVPYFAVLMSFAVACLAYLNVSSSGAAVFNWFVNLITVSGFIAWLVVMVTYLRWRKAMIYHGLYDSRPYKTPGQPYTSYFVFFIMALLTLTNGFPVFFPGNFSASSFLTAYITIPIFVGLYVGHKIWYKTPWSPPIENINVTAGLEEVEETVANDVPPVPKNFAEKMWFWLV